MSLQHGRCTIATPRTRCGMHVWRWVTWNPVCVVFFYVSSWFPPVTLSLYKLYKLSAVRKGVTPSIATPNLDRNSEIRKVWSRYHLQHPGKGLLCYPIFLGGPGFIHALALPPRLCQVVKPLSASQFITMVGVSNLRVWKLGSGYHCLPYWRPYIWDTKTHRSSTDKGMSKGYFTLGLIIGGMDL